MGTIGEIAPDDTTSSGTPALETPPDAQNRLAQVVSRVPATRNDVPSAASPRTPDQRSAADSTTGKKRWWLNIRRCFLGEETWWHGRKQARRYTFPFNGECILEGCPDRRLRRNFGLPRREPLACVGVALVRLLDNFHANQFHIECSLFRIKRNVPITGTLRKITSNFKPTAPMHDNITLATRS